MKRLFTVFMAITLAISLCSCNSGKTTEQAKETKQEVITLTPENAEDYFTFIADISDVDYTDMFGLSTAGDATLKLKAYSTVSGSYQNVKVTLKLNTTDKWYIAGEDSDDVTITFTLPATGEYNEEYHIQCAACNKELDKNCGFKIVSISGTFTPN